MPEFVTVGGITHSVSVISYEPIQKLLGVAPKLGGSLFPDDGGILSSLDRIPLLADPICTRPAKIITEKRTQR